MALACVITRSSSTQLLCVRAAQAQRAIVLQLTHLSAFQTCGHDLPAQRIFPQVTHCPQKRIKVAITERRERSLMCVRQCELLEKQQAKCARSCDLVIPMAMAKQQTHCPTKWRSARRLARAAWRGVRHAVRRDARLMLLVSHTVLIVWID